MVFLSESSKSSKPNITSNGKLISSITIKNFRGLEDIKIDELAQINLISGRNGVGKTSILEAIYLLHLPFSPAEITVLNSVRGLPASNFDDMFKDIFAKFDNEQRILLKAVDSATEPNSDIDLEIFLRHRREGVVVGSNPTTQNGSSSDGIVRIPSEFELVFRYSNARIGQPTESTAWITRSVDTGQPNLPFDDRLEYRFSDQKPVYWPPARYLSPRVGSSQFWANWFGELQREGSDAEILSMLQTVEPRISSVVPISTPGRIDMYAQLEGMRQRVPLALIGQGLNKAFEMAVLTRYAQGGILLIDEIENGLHFRSLPNMFNRLYELAELFNVQIFAVTHSDECLNAARATIGLTETRSLSYYRIGRVQNGVEAHRFDIDSLDEAHEFHMEIR